MDLKGPEENTIFESVSEAFCFSSNLNTDLTTKCFGMRVQGRHVIRMALTSVARLGGFPHWAGTNNPGWVLEKLAGLL